MCEYNFVFRSSVIKYNDFPFPCRRSYIACTTVWSSACYLFHRFPTIVVHCLTICICVVASVVYLSVKNIVLQSCNCLVPDRCKLDTSSTGCAPPPHPLHRQKFWQHIKASKLHIVTGKWRKDIQQTLFFFDFTLQDYFDDITDMNSSINVDQPVVGCRMVEDVSLRGQSEPLNRIFGFHHAKHILNF